MERNILTMEQESTKHYQPRPLTAEQQSKLGKTILAMQPQK